MKRKETDAEQETAEKWKDVAEVKDAYNESLLPEAGTPPKEGTAKKGSPLPEGGSPPRLP